MSYAAAFEDDMGGLDVDQLPSSLREQAKKERKSQGGYRYDGDADKQHVKQQRAAIWAWFRGLGSNLIKNGVNLTKVPLPVELCEPRSFLQRLTDSWAYIDLLHAAAACSDPVERLKLVIAFAVGGMRQQVSCDKPFNPILGETLQGKFTCGCAVYAEQISHHPPISCWQVLDHQGHFEYSGSSCWSATFTGNSVKGTQEGVSSVLFKSDGATVTWTLPAIFIRGVLFGDRVVKYHDTIRFEDKKNHLRCELSIDPHDPSKGLLKRVASKARHPRQRQRHDQLLGQLLHTEQDCPQQVLDSCSGSWLSELVWDKGVRSDNMPAPGSETGAVAADLLERVRSKQDNDNRSLGCHSIGSFSTTSGSTISGAEQEADLQHESSTCNGVACDNSHMANMLGIDDVLAPPGSGFSHAKPAQPKCSNSGDVRLPADVGAATTGLVVGHRSALGISVCKKLWDVKLTQVMHVVPLLEDDPMLLPSDQRYRPDVQALAGSNIHAAQLWKQVLEQIQRRDRTLRSRSDMGR